MLDNLFSIHKIMSTRVVAIIYEYDSLYRLTEANYSTGDYYHYTYDAVGNRLSQETLIGSVPLTNNYVYDAANRLTSVDSVAYTWDNNGNASIAKHSARRLLNDGVNTYTGVYPEQVEGIPPTA